MEKVTVFMAVSLLKISFYKFIVSNAKKNCIDDIDKFTTFYDYYFLNFSMEIIIILAAVRV